MAAAAPNTTPMGLNVATAGGGGGESTCGNTIRGNGEKTSRRGAGEIVRVPVFAPLV